jgi:hypothetical protein
MEKEKELDSMSKEEIQKVIDNYSNISMLFVNSLVEDDKFPDDEEAKAQLQQILLNQMLKDK